MKLVLIIGLPYFAAKVRHSLKQIDSRNKYIQLDTYYKFLDKIKYLLYLPFATTVYSINGTIEKSHALNLAFWLKKRVVMHWVGSDVIRAKQSYKTIKDSYSHKKQIIHLTDTPWFIEELKEIKIFANFLPIFTVSKTEMQAIPFPDKFNVLLYIPQDKQEFYGIQRLDRIARQLPEVSFMVAGLNKADIPLSENVHLLGWISNMNDYIQQSVVCMRFPQHDGLSFFVLESLLLQRYVIYNRPLPHTYYVKSDQEIVLTIKELYNLHKRKELHLNAEAKDWVSKAFSPNNMLTLKSILLNEQS